MREVGDNQDVLDSLAYGDELLKEVLGWERSENPVRRLEENMVSRRCTEASIKSFVGGARRFMRHCGWEPQFTEREAASFMGTMAGFKDGTMHYYRSMLKTFYLAMGKPAPFYGQKVHSDDAEEVAAASFSASQIREIIGLARRKGSPEAQYYLALSTIFGFRRIELGRITPANFNWNGSGQVTSYMAMQCAKHGRKRVHQIPAGLEPYLKGYHATPKPSWKMGTKFVEFCEEIGYKPPKGYSFHAVRHALVTGLIESGLDSLQVDRWMGWRSGQRGSPIMAAIYYSPEKLDEQVMAKHPFLGEWC